MSHADRNRTVATQEKQWLRELLDDTRVSGERREAFARMLDELESGMRQCLSTKQRQWVKEDHERLELGAKEATNDVSSGRVLAPAAQMDDSIFGPKALKPPPMRRVV